MSIDAKATAQNLSDAAQKGANPWTVLEACHDARKLVENLTADAVHSLRAHGETWAAIAAGLGTTRQAAQQRYGS